MATTTAAAPPTPEQIAQAIEIVRRLCAEVGQHPEITVERFVYPDDEDGDDLVTAIQGPLRKKMSSAAYMELINTIGWALIDADLLPPAVALSVYLAPAWR